jgi:signal transduction histidine kinase
MPNDKFRQRIGALLAEIEQLHVQPDSDLTVMRHELAALYARVAELEKQFSELEKGQQEACQPDLGTKVTVKAFESESAASTPARAAAPGLYEKEQVGFTYTGDRLEPLQAANLSALNLENVLQTPLTEADRPIGAMLVETPPDRPLSPDDARLAEVIAQRASLQIQNLRLLAAAERARAEAQAATRRFTHESWENFLDAIHQGERIGYAYDQREVAPFADPAPAAADLQETVNVLDEQVGRLFLEADPQHPLSAEDKALVAAVARQVGQQVENLRLLADASRARADAEETTRLLSRENWKTYIADHEETSLGFIYDTNLIQPVSAAQPPAVSYTQPLLVQGESIGQLGLLDVENLSENDVALVSDIAARVSTHLETLRLNDELRKRAAELQELDRLKSSFLANMSHELRTPLNSILGFSDVMLEGIDGPLTDYMENDLKLIQKNGQHLLHLINDVLDMAKIESGRMNLHPEKFKLQNLLEDVTSITSTLASEKNLNLFIDSASDSALEVFADVTRLRQVLINLVNNSIKFTEKGRIALKTARLPGEKVLITVKDTGIGIPPMQLETVFQEFAQVDTSTTRKVGGTGLGLPISRRLVEMHGGRLWAESTGVSGEGSTFFIEMPIEAKITETIEKTAK